MPAQPNATSITHQTRKTDPFIGVLMLDTRFDRPLGDAGNPHSYALPARMRIVEGAGSTDIVRDGRPSEPLVAAFLDAAKALEEEGACAITSTCGFLISIQNDIAKALSVPVLLSALAMYPDIRARHPQGRIGILTASSTSLGNGALSAAGIDAGDVVIAGMETSAVFRETYLLPKGAQRLTVDQAAIGAGLIERARGLLADDPGICAFLLECGNLPLYQAELAAVMGRPVYSILDGVNALVEG